MGRPPKLKVPKAKVAAAAAKAAVDDAPPPMLLDDWVVTLREVFQDVQALALERATHAGEGAQLHAASLAPALRRMRRVFRSDVGVGRALAEERWAQFLKELWLTATRIMAAPRVSAAVVHAFGALFGAFLSGAGGDERAAGKEPASAAKKRREEELRSLRELRLELLGRLLDATQAADKNVRLRVCHFLQIILNRLEDIECVMRRLGSL